MKTDIEGQKIMGSLIILYGPLLASNDDFINYLFYQTPYFTNKFDSIRILGNKKMENLKPFKMGDLSNFVGRSFHIFNKSSFRDIGGISVYHELIEFNFNGNKHHIFVYIKENFLHENIFKAISECMAPKAFSCDYGFSRTWSDNCLKAWQYVTGIRIATSINDALDQTENDIARWGKAYIREGIEYWSDKIRDVYPVNFLHGGPNGGHGALISNIEIHAGRLGQIVEIFDDYFAWTVEPNKIEDVKTILKDYIIR